MSAAQTRRAVLLLVVVILVVAVAGNFHFVYGSDRPLQRLAKVSWSLSETVVNLDEVSAMPLIAVRMKYPLLLQALERER